MIRDNIIKDVFSSPDGAELLRGLVQEYVYEMDVPLDEIKLNRAIGKRELVLDLLYAVRDNLEDLSAQEFYPLDRG